MREPSDGIIALGRFEMGDAPLLVEADRDPEHRLRFDFPEAFVASLSHSQEAIARWQRERDEGTRFPFAVRLVTTGELVGGVELKPLGDGMANLSYWTYAPHRRQGFATRAARLASDLAFRDLGYQSLRVVVDPDNVASRRVAERCGFRESGVLGGQVLYLRQTP